VYNREFSHKSVGEWSLKIGPHLPKLSSNIEWLTFLESQRSLVTAELKTDSQIDGPRFHDDALYKSTFYLLLTYLQTSHFNRLNRRLNNNKQYNNT